MPEKIPPPAGVKPLSVNNKQMEALGLKTGPGRKDVVAYKSFNKEECLAEVAKLGFYSAWYEIRAEVTASEAQDLLLVSDQEEKYGENWFVCLTPAAIEAYFWVSVCVRCVFHTLHVCRCILRAHALPAPHVPYRFLLLHVP